MNRQVAFKMKELKRDMAKMLLNNVAASAGSSGTASQTAGLPAFLTSNVDRGATGAKTNESAGPQPPLVQAPLETEPSCGQYRIGTDVVCHE